MKKFVLVLLGIFFSFLCLEISLQTAGLILKTVQKHKKDYTINTYDIIGNKNVITVMCIGESTTEGQYPLFLEEYLMKYIPNKKFNVIDSGYASIRLDDLYYKVKTNIEKYNPDIIVGMIGINDTTEYVFKIIPKKLKVIKFLNLLYYSYKNQNISRELEKEYNYNSIVSKKTDSTNNKLFDSMFKENNISKYPLLLLLSQTKKTETPYIYTMKNEFCKLVALKYYHNYLGKDITFDSLIEDILKTNHIKKEFKYGLNGILCITKSDYEQGLKNLDMADSVRLTYDYTEISKKYKKILDLIIKKNIQYIAMQYPVRDIGSLKRIIETTGYENDVIFVSNKDNFRNALMYEKRYEIFSDLFAWDFGHCQNYGNRLIADNLAKEILNIFKNNIRSN